MKLEILTSEREGIIHTEVIGMYKGKAVCYVTDRGEIPKEIKILMEANEARYIENGYRKVKMEVSS